MTLVSVFFIWGNFTNYKFSCVRHTQWKSHSNLNRLFRIICNSAINGNQSWSHCSGMQKHDGIGHGTNHVAKQRPCFDHHMCFLLLYKFAECYTSILFASFLFCTLTVNKYLFFVNIRINHTFGMLEKYHDNYGLIHNFLTPCFIGMSSYQSHTVRKSKRQSYMLFSNRHGACCISSVNFLAWRGEISIWCIKFQ